MSYLLVSPCISLHLLASPRASSRLLASPRISLFLSASGAAATEQRAGDGPPEHRPHTFKKKEERIASKEEEEEEKEEKEEHNGTLRTARRPRARSTLAVDRTVIRLQVDELAVAHCRDHDGRTSLALASFVRLPLSIPGSSIGENSLEGPLRRPYFPGSTQSKPSPIT
ncbi:hypothetical protein EDB80DRAFT_814882, partial [Ilyonectria destructans]